MERTQGEEKPFLCEDEGLASNQMYKIQRILALMDKNMTLVMALDH